MKTRITTTNSIKPFVFFSYLFLCNLSCSEHQLAAINEPQTLDYNLGEYKEVFTRTLNKVGLELRGSDMAFEEPSTFQETVIKVVQNQENVDALESLTSTSKWYNQVLNSSLNHGRSSQSQIVLDLSDLLITEIGEELLEDLLVKSYELTIHDFKKYLDERIETFDIENGGEHVNFILLYVATLQVFTSFYEENLDLFFNENGKNCVGSVAGWGLFEAVVGAGLGCAVGTLLAGPVGCVAGGSWFGWSWSRYWWSSWSHWWLCQWL